MMKYVFLVYRDERRWQTTSVHDRAAFEQACQSGEQDLIGSLHLTDVRRLQNNTALTVRILNGKISITDGRVPGGQEQLIQLLFIQARDLNAAIQIALQIPQAREGTIEVRSIVE